MDNTDQDIDTAGTEADDEFRQRHDGEPLPGYDATKGPLGHAPEGNGPAQPGESDPARGGEPATLHRGEDDDIAQARSPEFHDRPGSGGKR